MPNRRSCLKHSNNTFAPFLISESFFFSCLSPVWSLEDLLIDRESLFGTMGLCLFGSLGAGYQSVCPLQGDELGLGPVPVHICPVSAWTNSLVSRSSCKWKLTFLSTRMCLGEKCEVFVSIQLVQSWDPWILLA